MKAAASMTRGATVLGFALCMACALAAPATIGFVAPDEEPRYTNLLLGLQQGLREAGADAGVTIAEHRVRRGDPAQAAGAAESLVAGRARLAFVVGTELSRVVRSAAKELPIVLITPGDPVRAGLAASLARPGNNLTGMTFEFPELSAKRLQILKEIAATARRVGVVYDSRDASPRLGFAAVKDASAKLGMQLVEIDAQALLRSTDPAALAGKLDGLLLIPGGAITAVTETALKLATAQRVVSVVWVRNEATRESIVSYGVNDVEVARSAARLVARVLHGDSAGELPIEQPTKLQLVVNLKAAKALGLSIPQSVLLRADEVIE